MYRVIFGPLLLLLLLLSRFSCVRLCDPMDHSQPGTSVYGILQARILGWIALPFSRGIFPAQGLNLGRPHCRQIPYCLSHHRRQHAHKLQGLGSGHLYSVHQSRNGLFLKLKKILTEFFILVQLIYNVSGIQKSDSVIYIHTHTHTHIYSFSCSFPLQFIAIY